VLMKGGGKRNRPRSSGRGRDRTYLVDSGVKSGGGNLRYEEEGFSLSNSLSQERMCRVEIIGKSVVSGSFIDGVPSSVAEKRESKIGGETHRGSEDGTFFQGP